MNFIEFVRNRKLSENEARACARFLAFIRMEKTQLHLDKFIDQEFRKSPKAREGRPREK